MYFSEFFKPIIWYIVVLFVCFFCVPLIGYVLPPDIVNNIASSVEPTEGATAASIASSFIYYLSFNNINPIVVGVCSVVFTIRNGFKWYFPLIVAAMFAPMMLVYVQFAAWYCIEYVGMSYCGCGIGHVINKIRERNMY